MPQDYRDHEDRTVPFNDVLDSGAGVDMTGGFTDDNNGAGYHVGGYASTAIRLAPDGADVTVVCYWTQGDGGAFETSETKATTAAAATTLFFVNQGHMLSRVVFTGGGGATDYAIVESNQLPPSAAATPGLLDLPWLYAEGNMRADGSNLSYFTTISSDAAVYDFSGGPPNPRILAAGTYLVFAYSDWSVTGGVPAIGTRIRLSMGRTFAGAGGSNEEVHSGELTAGVNDTSGIAGHITWQTRFVWIVNVQATTPPVTLTLSAANSAASVIGSDDTAVTIVRLAETPYAGTF